MSYPVLGTVFERRDQGDHMLLAAGSWICYLVLVSIADATWSTSMVSALTRLASVFCFLAAVAVFLGSMPHFLQAPARITATLAIFGGSLQLLERSS